MRQEWEKAVRRSNWHAKHWERLCGEHFAPDCYEQRGKRKLLKSSAIPTVFDFPSYLLPKVVKERKCRAQKSPENNTITAVEEVTDDHSISSEETLEMACSTPSTTRMSELSSPQSDSMSFADASVQTDLIIADIFEMERTVNELKRKLGVERMRSYRLRKRKLTLESVITEFKSKNVLSDDLDNILRGKFSNSTLTLVQNEICNTDVAKSHRSYSEEVKQFCLNIFFHSSAAYRYLRTFLTLPHEKTIFGWLSKIDGTPGFTESALAVMQEKIRAKFEPECVLIVDAMSIRKQVIYDRHKGRYLGYIDTGNSDDDDPSLATEALVFLVVGLKTKWKFPIGYFMVDHVSAHHQQSLVVSALSLLHHWSADVKGVVLDGTYCNQRTGELLGISLKPESFKSSFSHPVTQKNVYFMLDPCHMIKLLRNLFATERELVDDDGYYIRWNLIELLHEVQKMSSLTAANKLKDSHINWRQQKMKVRLAAQVLSNSVAKGLEFMQRIGDPQFKYSSPTIKFLTKADRLFDRLNCSKSNGKGFKAPLTVHNISLIERDLFEILNYLLSLKMKNGNLVVNSRRKTCVLGFMSAVHGMLGIAKDLLFRREYSYQYFLSYNLSQDHIETFFSIIRSKGGFNNNPNVVQFMAAYKACIGRQGIQILHHSASANCIPQNEEDEVPFVFSDIELSLYENNVVTYISGFVVRSTSKQIKCPNCMEKLYAPQKSAFSLYHGLIDIKDNGGLIRPSSDVTKICKTAQMFLKQLHANQLSDKMLKKKIIASILQKIGYVFTNDHDCGLTSHSAQLFHQIVDTYLTTVLHHRGRLITERSVGKNVRSKNTHITLFKHQ